MFETLDGVSVFGPYFLAKLSHETQIILLVEKLKSCSLQNIFNEELVFWRSKEDSVTESLLSCLSHKRRNL